MSEEENRAIAEAATRWGKAREKWRETGHSRRTDTAYALIQLQQAADDLEAALRAAGRL